MHIRTFLRKIIPWWARYYHRLKIKGIENLPTKGSAIITPNHSGSFDYDNFVTMSALEQFTTQDLTRKRIWLCYHDKWVYFSGWGDLVQLFSPIPINLDGKGIPWRLTDFIVKKGELIAIMPEGHSACIWEGYKLWKFYPGVIRLHLRYKIPIIPTAMIGFVYAAPITSSLYIPQKMPPWTKEVMIPPVLPIRLKIVYGKQIEFAEYYEKEVSKQKMYELAGQVRKEVKKLIQNNL
ncbi:MAG: 1-acyl-sn-glycerol-3-phosphate acyltransferase [Candidatus Lokiarchaeota archaeon]|nr:1-acyl-sn-glycerol-3-phosphate acyltransferase [Candidatus Lokiarchaeota archaeon]